MERQTHNCHNSQNVTRKRVFKGPKCLDRKENTTFVSPPRVALRRSCRKILRKQCIESEKLFDFLKELADQASGSSAAKESKAKGKCLGHRKKWHNMSIKTKSPEKEELPKRHKTEPSESSSESELVICLETQSP
ncbi:uncharacterized protein LOC132852614 isoform X4 [Tachysurus vachellii]|uniref:uncharacterized protein LOC132852614 isoform X4 n=1 Tax=Tachysurus vachellii TaxID=175792 RepID=UPI00296B04D5|nr:uncharacterized protein LOC132852614 isoform X4 [Tachysurus vachellii]